MLKTRSENEGQRWAGEPSVCPAAVLTQCTKRHFMLFVTQKFFLMTRLLFGCHYNYMTHGRGPQQILSHSALLGCSGQCSEPTAVINKSSQVKENSLMSKLNKYYAWKHISLIKHKKAINDSFLSVYLLICKSFFSPNHHLLMEASLTCLSTRGQFQDINPPYKCCTTHGKRHSGTKFERVCLIVFHESSVWHAMPNWEP